MSARGSTTILKRFIDQGYFFTVKRGVGARLKSKRVGLRGRSGKSIVGGWLARLGVMET